MTDGQTPHAADFRAERAQIARRAIPGIDRHRRVDDGLFGPGSVTWKVWSSPSMFVAAYRSVIVQMMLAPVATAVNQFSSYTGDPIGRTRRTGHYFAAVALGDTPTAQATARFVNGLHSRVQVTEPVSGRVRTANEPELAMYVHVTAWHSALTCYLRYAGGLTDAEQARFWDESRRGSELVGVKPDSAPGTREEVRDYFAGINPQLCVNTDAREIFDFFVSPRFPARQIHLHAGWRFLKRLAIPTLPTRIRRWANVDQPQAIDQLMLPVGRLNDLILRQPVLRRGTRWLAPEAYDIVMSALKREREWHRTGS